MEVGDHIRVSLPIDRIVDGAIRKAIDSTSGTKYQIDFEQDQTVLIDSRQIVAECC